MEEESSEGKQKSLPYYVSDVPVNGGAKVGENYRKPVVRYWHTNVEPAPRPNIYHPYKKVNTPHNTSVAKTNSSTGDINTTTPKNNAAAKHNFMPLTSNKPDGKNVDESVPKKENSSPEPLPSHLSIFQTTNPQHLKKTIELLDNEDPIFHLESSDEDEVIEVALPPKPTIMIESSDDEEVTIQLPSAKLKGQENLSDNVDREISTSPVPSVVSSVSDDFIRGDCIALNISSRRPDNHSFDFSLHGADLNITPSKKKKKKKNKENVNVTSTPILVESPEKPTSDTFFATPKSKLKNKKQKKLYVVSEKRLPVADISDSDSNQSIIDITRNSNTHVVSEKSLNIDVYECNSNMSNPSEPVKEIDNIQKAAVTEADSSDNSITLEKPSDTVKDLSDSPTDLEIVNTVIDLTSTDQPKESISDILENIVMGNVTGFEESEDNFEQQIDLTEPPKVTETSKYASTKVPAILFDNLDFDNLKGKDRVCRSRRYSLTTLRAEMEKFYNESWGGEDFNHKELQKSMSRDKSLWEIDPKDRIPTQSRKRPNCSYCNRTGHRDDMCRRRPAICHMCGNAGHFEPRCPSKICVNCGAPNYVYSTQCRNCAMWGRVSCAACGQYGHPASHCPDIWRCYHNTTDLSMPLEENHQKKKYNMMFCSGCAQRGHLIHTCRFYIPFSGLPINSPYVRFYRPICSPIQNNQTNNANNQRNKSPHHKSSAPDSTVSPAPVRNNPNKRQSKSPVIHETHSNKKRNMSTSDAEGKLSKSPGPVGESQRKLSQSLEHKDQEPKPAEENVTVNQSRAEPEKAPDFIPIFSSNRDKKGQIIQDNEVSDTSDIITSARVYITSDIVDNLKTEDGQLWLKETTEKNRVLVENSEITSYLSIKGKSVDQESFQYALRDWAKAKTESPKFNNEADDSRTSDLALSPSPMIRTKDLPKRRVKLMRIIGQALDSLKTPWLDPAPIYKELTYLKNHHQNLLSQKTVNTQKLQHSRAHLRRVSKALNIVLLGQAGLADGAKHVAELKAMHNKLLNGKFKIISEDMFEQIAHHYNILFTGYCRHDYEDLLRSYYQRQHTFAKKKKASFKVNPKKVFNPVPSQNLLPMIPKLNVPAATRDNGNKGEKARPKAHVVKANFNKLVFYHKRLLQARPCDAVLKKTKVELVRKLHAYIGSLGNSTPSAKTLKKVRKVQEQAQVFLNNQSV